MVHLSTLPWHGTHNNLGEQAMREQVIMRKIIGCFRSEKGAENYQYIASLLATWRLQGKNGFEEL
jgi:transposase